MVFEAAMLNAQDVVADQSSLAVNACGLFYASLQKCTKDFFMPFLSLVLAKGLEFRITTSKR